jgi:hypothetical protein
MKTSDLKLIKKNGGNAYVSECNDWILIKKPRNKNKRTGYGYEIRHVGHALRIRVDNLATAKKVIVDIINNDYIYEQLPSPLLMRTKELNPMSVIGVDISTKIWDLKRFGQDAIIEVKNG